MKCYFASNKIAENVFELNACANSFSVPIPTKKTKFKDIGFEGSEKQTQNGNAKKKTGSERKSKDGCVAIGQVGI